MRPNTTLDRALTALRIVTAARWIIERDPKLGQIFNKLLEVEMDLQETVTLLRKRAAGHA